ncbi:ClpP/crotonase-like domain-containing protein [Lipomyces arxii]|uniref:ClpP/crotonase-like domain-containing protein n=1 Tax=Lipomyces arxii TaxID=56418 RepID=UPI0034CE5EEB
MVTLPLTLQIYDESGKGTVTLSKAGSGLYYLLTFSAPPDNRLTPEMCFTLQHALDIVEDELLLVQKLPLVTTSGIEKFYSNGLNLELAKSTRGFWDDSFYPVLKRFLQFPTACIAVVNGHAFAGGFMMAMCHDYRIMNPSRGFLCLNEIEFGAPLKAPMSGIFRHKLTPAVYQKIVLEATRFTADLAIANHIIDAKGSLEDADEFIKARKLHKYCQSPAYGALKSEMWRDIIHFCDSPFEYEEKLMQESENIDEKRKKLRYSKVVNSKL